MRCPHCGKSWGWLSTYRYSAPGIADPPGRPQIWPVRSTLRQGDKDDAWTVRYWRGSAAHALQICMHCWEAVS